MKKKIWIPILLSSALLSSAIALAACEHSHSWVRSSNATHHFYECDCGQIKEKEPHDFSNGKCPVCGKQTSEGLSFALSSDQSYYLVENLGNCTDTDVVIPSVYNGKAVTRIADNAFIRCNTIESVYIPEGVEWIGAFAFMDSGLKELYLPDSVREISYSAFSNCPNLESIAVGTGLSRIYNLAFGNCKALKSVYLSDLAAWCSVDAMSNPLTGAKDLYLNGELITELVIPEEVKEISPHAFSGSAITTLTITGGVTKIGEAAFSHCQRLKKVNVTGDLLEIGHDAFYSCYELTKVTLPDSLREIKSNAFEYCKLLSELSLGKGVTKIGRSAFRNCSSLTKVVIPESVEEIDQNAFSSPALTVYCEATNASENWHSDWASDSDYNVPIVFNCRTNERDWAGNYYAVIDGVRYRLGNGEATVIRQSASLRGDVVIPERVTYNKVEYTVQAITKLAFCDCKMLTGITLADTITRIGQSAFLRCSTLEEIALPYGVTSIEDRTFADCKALKKIVLPKTVTFIGNNAFKDDRALTNIQYGGRKAEWNALEKGLGWNDGTAFYSVLCKDGTLDMSGREITLGIISRR